MTPTLILMAKAARAGQVKTRLATGLGTIPATWWYRHQLAHAIRQLKDPRWKLTLAITPDFARGPWPSNLTCMPQGRGDLGARMRRLLICGRPGPVLVVGADIPGLDRAHVQRAFALLGRHDVVFGPATDGGFWGVGLKPVHGVPPDLFRAVRWSGQHALADSVATCAGLRVGYAGTLRDIDTEADLAAFRHDLHRGAC